MFRLLVIENEAVQAFCFTRGSRPATNVVYPSEFLQIAPQRPQKYWEALPLPSEPSVQPVKFYDDSMLKEDDSEEIAWVEPASSFSRLADEKRVHDAKSFFPHVSSSGRNAGKIPQRYLQLFEEFPSEML